MTPVPSALPVPRLLQSLGSVLSGSSARQLLLLTLGDAPETGHRGPGPLLEGRGSFFWRGGCQNAGSGLRSSPSELLMLELEQGLGLGAGPVTQVKRKGLTGKIPLRELSRQCRGEGMVAVSSFGHCHVPGLTVICGLPRRRLLLGTSPRPCPRWGGSQASPLGPSLSAVQFLGSGLFNPLSIVKEQGQAACGLGTGISLRQFSRPWSGEFPGGYPFPSRCPRLFLGLLKSRSPSLLLAEEKLVGVPWEPEG